MTQEISQEMAQGKKQGMTQGMTSGEYSFHCEKDTAEVRMFLTENIVGGSGATEARRKREAMMMRVAEAFKGRGADKWIYADSLATLRINLDEFTPLSFVNTVLAMGETAQNPRGGWRSFGEELKKFSCRQGEDAGFGSLMWHVSDWSGDNIYRGNLKELTENYDGARSMTLSLDYLTRNRDEFAALKNPELYEEVRMIEMGFRNHKIPYLPRQAAGNKEILEDMRNGDIIALVNDKSGSDTYAVGVVVIRGDGPHLIHFDPKAGVVVEEAEPLKRYMNKEAKYIKGFRWFRIA
ncbi:MAG: DUF1460 domain-containing protein [Muribaculaceae bacterium]|nr:DUF1460 domain-containing protein [Muribaculaceae bacterium]